MSDIMDDEEITPEEGLSMDLEMLREDLIGELQAINQYQEHIDILGDEEIVTTLEHIIAEEKEHVAELVKLIKELDSVQAEKFENLP